jgi:hypothetical protein
MVQGAELGPVGLGQAISSGGDLPKVGIGLLPHYHPKIWQSKISDPS